MDSAWTLGHAGAMFAMWVAMMAAMMLPVAWPMLRLVATLNRNRRARGAPYVSTAVFGAGYLAVWSAFGLAAAALQWTLATFARLDAMAPAPPTLAGLLLLGAGLYQLTPLKARCLAHCRSPLGFLTLHWREGAHGQFELGLRHGAYCVGCCWALMALLFAAGVMNLAAILLLVALVIAERMLPWGERLARAVGVALVLAGAAAIAYGIA
ncbi:MAG: DUF2182 domain-containing protein [Rhodospirillales bacterium]|nr:DUF2182 domain-containing protein [Rhodospirillales bacterium]